MVKAEKEKAMFKKICSALGINVSANDFLIPSYWWKTASVKDVKDKIASGVDINARDKYGHTALMYAVKHNENPEIIKTLLDAGADKAKPGEGLTVLMLAAGNNQNPEIIETLLGAGADIEARSKDDWTTLMWAAYYNKNPEIITTLLDAGADINARGKNDWTALMVAAGNNQNPDIVLTLLALGADASVKDIHDRTAYDYILKNDALKESEVRWKLNELQYE